MQDFEVELPFCIFSRRQWACCFRICRRRLVLLLRVCPTSHLERTIDWGTTVGGLGAPRLARRIPTPSTPGKMADFSWRIKGTRLVSVSPSPKNSLQVLNAISGEVSAARAVARKGASTLIPENRKNSGSRGNQKWGSLCLSRSLRWKWTRLREKGYYARFVNAPGIYCLSSSN